LVHRVLTTLNLLEILRYCPFPLIKNELTQLRIALVYGAENLRFLADGGVCLRGLEIGNLSQAQSMRSTKLLQRLTVLTLALITLLLMGSAVVLTDAAGRTFILQQLNPIPERAVLFVIASGLTVLASLGRRRLKQGPQIT